MGKSLISLGTLRGADMLLMTLRLPVALSVSFADSSPTGGAKSTPVGVGQVVVRRTSLRLCLTTRLPGLTAVRLAPPSGELARRPQGGETERGASTFPTKPTFYPYTTKTTKHLFSGRFVFFVGFVAFVIPLGGREIVISLISLKSWVSGGTVKS